MVGSTEHVKSAAERQTQVGLAGVAIAHFQQASGEIRAREGVVGTMRQRMPVGVGGGGIFAVQQQNARELFQYVEVTRGSIASTVEYLARLAAVVMLEVQAGKVQLQLNGVGCQCQTAFDDGDALIEASGLGKLAGEFLERRQKRRAPRRCPAQLFDRFRTASAAAQRCPEQGFDNGVVTAARCLFEGRDRLFATVQREEGLGQYRCGGGVGPAAPQHFGGEPFGLGELPRSQRDGGALEQPGAASAGWG